MTPEQYRRLALSLPSVAQGSHHDHPDFRVSDKIFASLWKGGGVVMLKPSQQSVLIKSHPDTFSPSTGAWGRKGSTMVNLQTSDMSVVLEALKTAWRNKSKGQ